MIAQAVASEKQVQDRLKEKGFELTKERTKTGTYWKHKDTGKHLLVPFSLDGFYPNWMLADLEEEIGKINPWDNLKRH